MIDPQERINIELSALPEKIRFERMETMLEFHKSIKEALINKNNSLEIYQLATAMNLYMATLPMEQILQSR